MDDEVDDAPRERLTNDRVAQIIGVVLLILLLGCCCGLVGDQRIPSAPRPPPAPQPQPQPVFDQPMWLDVKIRIDWDEYKRRPSLRIVGDTNLPVGMRPGAHIDCLDARGLGADRFDPDSDSCMVVTGSDGSTANMLICTFSYEPLGGKPRPLAPLSGPGGCSVTMDWIQTYQTIADPHREEVRHALGMNGERLRGVGVRHVDQDRGYDRVILAEFDLDLARLVEPAPENVQRFTNTATPTTPD